MNARLVPSFKFAVMTRVCFNPVCLWSLVFMNNLLVYLLLFMFCASF